MKIGYTEFSFGYAFTENLIRSSAQAPNGAPVFPNLVQEASLGYDVQINFPGVPLFFQFKLPELMIRNNAAEISTLQLPGFAVPFFRMHLMRRDLSQQHKRLIEWEQKFPGTVFYASPCLDTFSQFNLAYNAGQIHERSAFFSPVEIGPLPDDKDHAVSYQAGSPTAYFCSEPHEIAAIDYEVLSGTAREFFHRPEYLVLERVAKQVRDTIRELVSPQMRNVESALAQRIRAKRSSQPDRPPVAPESEQTIENILVSREMVRIDLGVDLLIAQPHT